MIRWLLDHGIAAIPKSSNTNRLKENADVFDFTEEDMHKLDSMHDNYRMGWYPGHWRES